MHQPWFIAMSPDIMLVKGPACAADLHKTLIQCLFKTSLPAQASVKNEKEGYCNSGSSNQWDTPAKRRWHFFDSVGTQNERPVCKPFCSFCRFGTLTTQKRQGTWTGLWHYCAYPEFQRCQKNASASSLKCLIDLTILNCNILPSPSLLKLEQAIRSWRDMK